MERRFGSVIALFKESTLAGVIEMALKRIKKDKESYALLVVCVVTLIFALQNQAVHLSADRHLASIENITPDQQAEQDTVLLKKADRAPSSLKQRVHNLLKLGTDPVQAGLRSRFKTQNKHGLRI